MIERYLRRKISPDRGGFPMEVGMIVPGMAGGK